ncbi:hypothetical protein TrST_g11336 [Triparma strigata]|uniref:SGF29 C-terminal domain-containing protein n=1 Tax=Triparma strigata TaxID=1606541 RepID=A0A9W7EA58_9STRA|nr:hypothetical protein TrST_g11336 [Triparma strigata]
MSKAAANARTYPKGLATDFRQMQPQKLFDYVEYFSVSIRPDAPAPELACNVASHFLALDVDEEAVLGGFLRTCDGEKDYADDNKVIINTVPSVQAHKRKRAKTAARPGEQVAAKVSRSDENGSWILASVQSYSRDSESYDVQDEDDITKLIRLPYTNVMRLGNGTEIFRKGGPCMAIFPETTSFYKAVVSKAPVWRVDRQGNPICSELILKFMDDEDESGKTPHRRVPSRYVIQLPELYFEDHTAL